MRLLFTHVWDADDRLVVDDPVGLTREAVIAACGIDPINDRPPAAVRYVDDSISIPETDATA